jgi:hypothetical protein
MTGVGRKQLTAISRLSRMAPDEISVGRLPEAIEDTEDTEEAFHRMNKILDHVFLRLFALTLGRSYRNSANSACNDAIMLTGVVLALPLAFVWTGLAVVMPSIGKPTLSVGSVAVLLLTIVPLMCVVNRRFTTYRLSPEAAARYSSRSQRVGTFVVLIGLLMSAPIAFGLLLGVLLQ